MSVHTCPVCGGHRGRTFTLPKEIKKAITETYHNAGGVELYFGEKRLQLADQCNICDFKKIKHFYKSL